MPVAVNVDTAESDVASLAPSDLEANLGDVGITLAHSEAELSAAIGTSRTGRSAWRNFMLVGLALLLAESLFAERLRQGKLGRNKQAVTMPESLGGAQDG